MYVFHYFFLSALSSVRCSGVGDKLLRPGYLHPLGGGGQAPQARVSSPPGGGGKMPRVRGIPQGIFIPEGRQTAQRQLHSPCREGKGEGSSYPGFKINLYTGSVCLFVHIVAWYTRGYTYIFTS